jgi:5'-AMP-activated protein kinase regulatory beta subunit
MDASIPARMSPSRPVKISTAPSKEVSPQAATNFTHPHEGQAHEMEGDMDDIVPTVFRWEHGGRNVYITGTFNNWERQIAMHRSGNDFSYVHNLKRGKHAYKFIVDDEWRYAPDQPTIADIEGRTNNFIDVSDFTPYQGDENFFERSKERKMPDSEYNQVIPDIDEYTKEPPGLPPHLRLIILNKPPPTPDPLTLPVPQHVALNHLYCTAIKDGMMVLGATQRYRQKHMTLVFYSQMPEGSC